MTDLSPEARSLFAAERSADRPSPKQAERLRRGVARRLGLGAFVVGSASLSAAASTATVATVGAKSTLWIVAMVGAGTLAGGAITGASLGWGDSEPSAPLAVTAKSADSRSSSSSGRVAPLAPGDLAPVGRAEGTSGPSSPPPVPPSAARTAARPDAPDDIAVQVELLRQSQQALLQGRPDRALTKLREHESRFPNSSLLQERRAGRVFALCALGQLEQGRREATAFIKQFPQSPLLARVEQACEGKAGAQGPSR